MFILLTLKESEDK